MKKLRASKASIMALTLLMLSACGSLRPVDPPPIVQHPYLSNVLWTQGCLAKTDILCYSLSRHLQEEPAKIRKHW